LQRPVEDLCLTDLHIVAKAESRRGVGRQAGGRGGTHTRCVLKLLNQHLAVSTHRPPFVRETRLIVKQAKEAVEEVRVRHAEGITHLAYLHGFEDARVRELLEHHAPLDSGGRLGRVRFDAADEVGAGALEQLHECLKLLGEHRTHRRFTTLARAKRCALVRCAGVARGAEREERRDDGGGGGLECGDELGRDIVDGLLEEALSGVDHVARVVLDCEEVRRLEARRVPRMLALREGCVELV